jgi:hypothetical protein
MGDRTFVEIHIRQHTYNKILKEHFKNCEDTFADHICSSSIESEDGIVILKDYECNYAQWDSLEGLLAEEEYDKYWEPGGDYPGGEAHQRKIKRKYNYFEISNSERDMSTALESLLNQIKDEADPEIIKKEIQSRIDNIVPFKVEPLRKPNSLDFIEEGI